MDKCVLHSQAVSSGRNSASAGMLLPSTLRTPFFRSVNSAVIIIGPTPTNSCFIDLFHCRHRRSRRRSINGADFLVFRFCQTLLEVCPLVTFLATMATLAIKLGWSVPLSRGTLCLYLALALALCKGSRLSQSATQLWPSIFARVVLLAGRLVQEKLKKECPCVVSSSAARCTTLRDEE